MTRRGRLVQLHRGGVVLDASASPAWLVREQGPRWSASACRRSPMTAPGGPWTWAWRWCPCA